MFDCSRGDLIALTLASASLKQAGSSSLVKEDNSARKWATRPCRLPQLSEFGLARHELTTALRLARRRARRASLAASRSSRLCSRVRSRACWTSRVLSAISAAICLSGSTLALLARADRQANQVAPNAAKVAMTPEIAVSTVQNTVIRVEGDGWQRKGPGAELNRGT